MPQWRSVDIAYIRLNRWTPGFAVGRAIERSRWNWYPGYAELLTVSMHYLALANLICGTHRNIILALCRRS